MRRLGDSFPGSATLGSPDTHPLPRRDRPPYHGLVAFDRLDVHVGKPEQDVTASKGVRQVHSPADPVR